MHIFVLWLMTRVLVIDGCQHSGGTCSINGVFFSLFHYLVAVEIHYCEERKCFM
jgi:hypothetical protein